ncbi:YidH family protein [Nocardia sp. NBC_01009]|uniref:YidH family protein n=1 Tax=Nocardia sp. NBC_01009 TaxID=2975996 RepID=UPI00386A991F|nr:DUF202 domain-containing protein [Nocardia sp. NBC_01009]
MRVDDIDHDSGIGFTGAPRAVSSVTTPAPTDANDVEVLDYRFSLANERTFLAWIRTALGLLAGGVAVQTLAEQFSTSSLRRATAGGCALLALLIAAVAHRHWRRVEAAMRRGDPLPGSAMVPLLAIGVIAIATIATVAVMVA